MSVRALGRASTAAASLLLSAGVGVASFTGVGLRDVRALGCIVAKLIAVVAGSTELTSRAVAVTHGGSRSRCRALPSHVSMQVTVVTQGARSSKPWATRRVVSG